MNRRRFLKVASGGNRLPRTGLIWTGPVDTIGLSASALLAALPAEHRAIYFSDPEDDTTLLDDAIIITNIEDSPYLNDGGELVGTEARGYAQYANGTAESTLRRAYKILGAYDVLFGGEGVTFNGEPVTW